MIVSENPHPRQAGSGEKEWDHHPRWTRRPGTAARASKRDGQEGMSSPEHRSGSQQDAGLLPFNPPTRNPAAASHSYGNHVHAGSYIPGAKKQSELKHPSINRASNR